MSVSHSSGGEERGREGGKFKLDHLGQMPCSVQHNQKMAVNKDFAVAF